VEHVATPSLLKGLADKAYVAPAVLDEKDLSILAGLSF